MASLWAGPLYPVGVGSNVAVYLMLAHATMTTSDDELAVHMYDGVPPTRVPGCFGFCPSPGSFRGQRADLPGAGTAHAVGPDWGPGGLCSLLWGGTARLSTHGRPQASKGPGTGGRPGHGPFCCPFRPKGGSHTCCPRRPLCMSDYDHRAWKSDTFRLYTFCIPDQLWHTSERVL